MKKYLVLESCGMFKTVSANEYESTYELLKDNVKGFIECVSWIKPFADKGIDLWINEEGKLNDLEPSLVIRDKDRYVELLCGNIVFARNNGYGETIPLEDEDFDFIKSTLRKELASILFNNPFTGSVLSNRVPVVDLY